MQMAATAYLQDSDDWNAVQLILTGFTGTLKLWWENFLIEKERFYVSKSLNEEEYYSENNSTSSETDKSQTDPKKEIEKIENCLCQINMLTADQELLLEMIDQIEDKEVKTKYIRKVLE